MSTRVVDRVDEWDDRPFTGGYGALQDLADGDFSGVVRAGGAELYMTKGTVVGIRRGTVEDFEDAEGTVYEAPTPALPLLAVMQERSEEVRAQYYTEDTAISEVDGTLGDGGFTGFVELSENVLSGDYYLVYHRGHSMSVAFVGNARQLLEGDEAFERADDEVGIYEVRPVDVDQIEIPEPAEPEPEPAAETPEAASAAADEPVADPEADGEPAGADADSAAGSDGAGEAASAASSDPTEADDDDATEADDDDATDPAESAATATEGREPETDEPGVGEEAGQTRADEASTANRADAESGDRPADADDATVAGEDPAGRTRQSADGPDEGREGPAPGTTGAQRDRSPDEAAGSEGESGRSERDSAARAQERREERPRERQDRGAEAGVRAGGQSQGARPEPAGGQAQSATDRPASVEGGAALETRAVPSLDPERTETVERSSGGDDARSRDDAPRRDATPQPRASAADAERETEQTAAGTDEAVGTEEEPQSGTSERESATAGTERLGELESEIDEREATIERLEGELDEREEESERLQEELASVREERDDLAAEVERLEGELEQLETEFGAATDAERRTTPQEALDGTDIFVRYHSKGDATLEKARGSGTRRTDVEDNLRLEKHTQFDADSVAVGGRAYAEFLESTLEYQFVEWVITDLLFEIRDTGHEEALGTLYDALPDVDRAELNGTVDVVYAEDGQETRSTEAFDVVLRDRMGEPLVVANLNDSREAATESMMEGLVTAAERVGQSGDDFAAAFLVTRSFFEPGALETASEATRSGLFSRDKRRSFVNLSRKHGYHLCLVEARNRNFHLAVPEL